MKALRLVPAAIGGLIGALIGVAPASAPAQQQSIVVSPPMAQPGGGALFPSGGSLFPTPMPPQNGGRGSRGDLRGGLHGGGRERGFIGGGGVIFYEEPQVVHDVVVVHDQPEPPPPPPPPPRDPYVVGRTYRSLPGSCLKMIQGSGSYFHCGEGWYRQVGSLYRAVGMP